jgi:hypothetical protein
MAQRSTDEQFRAMCIYMVDVWTRPAKEEKGLQRRYQRDSMKSPMASRVRRKVSRRRSRLGYSAASIAPREVTP